MDKQTVVLKDENATKKFAFNFAKKLKKGEVVELKGDVGSGKTYFVRALVEALGAGKASSPTFVIKNEYTNGEFPIVHFDFYRLANPGLISEELEEALSAGDNLVVVEWAENVKEVLPKDRYKILFKVTGDKSRELTIRR